MRTKSIIQAVRVSALIICILFYSSKRALAQTIPSLFFGQNAWMPDSCGNTKPQGKLESNWNYVAQSNVKFIRFGGTAIDGNKPTYLQYQKIVDSIRARGMEPILEVPFGPNLYDSSKASAIVRYINVTNGRKVKYWIIANEPNVYSPPYNNAFEISSYIKKFAIAMKKVDSTIKIIGPELSYMPTDVNDAVYKVMDSLTTWGGSKSIVDLIGTGQGRASGKAYIDYFSYHMYNFDGSGTNTKSRAWLISRLTSSDTAGMGWIKRRCNSINANRSSYPLKPVMTEANICFYVGNPPTDPSDDKFVRIKTSSFFAGQHWSQLMSLGLYQGLEWINFWSVIEGDEVGYLFNSNSAKKSTYYHIEQMAKWFTGTHYIGLDDTGGVDKPNIKVFGSKSGNHIAILILDQDTFTWGSKPYKIRLDNSYASSWTGLKMKMNMGTYSTEYQDTIKASSTTLLIFDCNGNISKKYRYEQTDSLNPFKSVWAASNPSTLLSVSISPSIAQRKSYCGATFTASATGCSGTVTYSWFANGVFFQTGSSFTYDDLNSASITVTASCSSTGACNPASASAVYYHIAGTPCDPGQPERNELNIETNNSLVLMPNPTTGHTTIYFESSGPQAEIVITDIFGRIIWRDRTPMQNGQFELDCSSYAEGIYFVALVVEDRVVATQRLVVQK